MGVVILVEDPVTLALRLFKRHWILYEDDDSLLNHKSFATKLLYYIY